MGRQLAIEARMLGQRIGPYRIVSKLAEGGMGVVFEAFHVPLQQRAALKLMPQTGLDPREVERFFAEARMAARVRHPNIVGVRDVGVHERTFYLAMDLVEGESLQQRIEREGPLAPVEAARLLLDLCRGVQAAHASNVLHRDLKPANVLLPRDGGAPLLTDFGVAKDLDRSNSLTTTGEILGTPSHMSPEQADGLRPSVRTDVYGLGAILYHMLTGRPPHTGDHLVEVLTAVIIDPVTAPSALVDGVPEHLEAICLRCLDKAPAARFASAADLAEELERFLAGHWRASRRLRRPRFLGRAFAAAAVLAAVTALGIRIAGLGDAPTGPGSDATQTATASRAAARPQPLPPIQLAASGRELAELETLELAEPWLATIDARGARLEGRGTAQPALLLPLTLLGQRLDVEVDLDVARLEPGAAVDVLLTSADGQTRVGFAVQPSSATPFARARLGALLIAQSGDDDRTQPAADLPRGRVRLSVERRQVRLWTAAGKLLGAAELARPAQRGDYTLEVGLNRRSRGDWAALAEARLASLCLRAPQGGLRLRTTRGPRHEVQRLGRQVAAGQRAALPRLLTLGRHTDARVRQPAFYLHAVTADGDIKTITERLKLYWELSEHGERWFQRRWRADLFRLSPLVRRALARACVSRLRSRGAAVTPEALARRAASLIRSQRDPALAALLFLASGPTGQRFPLERGLAWARAGDLTRGLLLLAPLERANPGVTQGEAGLAAYRLGQPDRARELWRHDAGPYAETLARVE